MRCPFCGYKEDKVVDSRESREGDAIRRRRECLQCGKRFTTYEQVEEMTPMVVKSDGRREPFSREKILAGLKRACEKRPVSVETLEELVLEVERTLQARLEKEVSSQVIGGIVVEKLKGIDEVAFVRFASVYKKFKDVSDFASEVQKLKG
jgi:transcriptional repressor NrdR